MVCESDFVGICTFALTIACILLIMGSVIFQIQEVSKEQNRINNAFHWKEISLKYPDTKIIVDYNMLYANYYPKEYEGYVPSDHCIIDHYNYPVIIKIIKDGIEEKGVLHNKNDFLDCPTIDKRIFIHNKTIWFEEIPKPKIETKIETKEKGKRSMRDYVIMFLIALIVMKSNVTWRFIFRPLKKFIKNIVKEWDES